MREIEIKGKGKERQGTSRSPHKAKDQEIERIKQSRRIKDVTEKALAYLCRRERDETAYTYLFSISVIVMERPHCGMSKHIIIIWTLELAFGL